MHMIIVRLEVKPERVDDFLRLRLPIRNWSESLVDSV